MAHLARRMGESFQQMLGRRLTPLEFEAAAAVAEEWTFMEKLAVVTAERIDWLRWIMQTVNSKPNSKVTQPFHMPRPGEPIPESDRPMPAKELAEKLSRGEL